MPGSGRSRGWRAAALGRASATGARLLADSLRGVPLVPDASDGRFAAELTVAALPAVAHGTSSAEVLVKRELTVRLGA